MCLLDPGQLPIDRGGQLLLPVLERELPRVGGPLDRQGLVAGPRVRGRKREEIPRRLGVAWQRQLLELGDRLLRFPKPDQHAAQIEAGEPEVGPARRGLPVLFGGGAGEPLTLQDLAEVVVRVGVLRVDGDRQSVGFGRAIPLRLHPEQHAVIVVGIAEVDAERDDRAIVGLRPGPVLDLTVQRDQVRVRLRERRVAGDCGFVGRDRARQIAGARELQPSREIRRGVISEAR